MHNGSFTTQTGVKAMRRCLQEVKKRDVSLQGENKCVIKHRGRRGHDGGVMIHQSREAEEEEVYVCSVVQVRRNREECDGND